MSISAEDLRAIVREEVAKALRRSFLELLPYVSDEEQKEIEEEFESPERWEDEFEELK